jgi:hypothetical protein
MTVALTCETKILNNPQNEFYLVNPDFIDDTKLEGFILLNLPFFSNSGMICTSALFSVNAHYFQDHVQEHRIPSSREPYFQALC